MEEAGGGGQGKTTQTHVNATRPVDLLMPSQVPPASTSRPESTLSLVVSTWSADERPSLEAEAVDEASNEWKDAGRVGRARSSSRFAHRMLLWSLRGQRGHGKKKKRMGVETQFEGQAKGWTHSAYFGCVRDQKPTHMLSEQKCGGLGQKEWISQLDGNDRVLSVPDCLTRTKSGRVRVPIMMCGVCARHQILNSLHG